MKSYLTILGVMISISANAAVYYVTPTGSGSMNGASWSDAAPGNNLQLIIDGASIGDSIWVACGTYYPTSGTDRSISFAMREGVSIFGSFSGTETNFNERSIATNGLCSILSGEIGAAGTDDNSYTVVYNQDLTNAAVLDGFIIRDGNDDRTPTNDGDGLGGGIYNHGFGGSGFCHPTIRNCQFINNSASWGGGAFNNGYGGGNSQPIYVNCVFTQNFAYIEAGGMDSYGVGGTASPTLYNCIFYKNTSTTNVGAMYCWGGNSGGNCHPVLINCAFINNRALNGYGGAFIADNLDENLTTSSGSCTVTMQNCIVWGNSATGTGQQFYVRGSGAQVLATYSDIDTSGQSAPHVISGSGTGNISVDPAMVDTSNGAGLDGLWLTQDDALSLHVLSNCRNTGDNTGVYATDILGSNRIAETIVDMGPYEYNSMSIDDLNPNLIQVYPNPSSGLVTIDLQKTASGQINVFDCNGSLVITRYLNQTKELTMQLDIIPGTYFIHFIGDNDTQITYPIIIYK